LFSPEPTKRAAPTEKASHTGTSYKTALSILLWESRSSARWASLLTYVLNPFITSPLFLGLALAHLGAPPEEIVRVTALAFILFTLIPLLYLVYLVKKGHAQTLEVRNRKQRIRPFLFGLGIHILGIAWLSQYIQTAHPFFVGILFIQALNLFLILLITLWWKISIHLVSFASLISSLFFIYTHPWPPADTPSDFTLPVFIYGLIPFLFLLAWARVRLSAHTWTQVIGGMLFGLIVPYIELTLLYYYLK